MLHEIGRIVVKKRGREAGLKCVIVDVLSDKMVLVTGPKSLTGVRRRRVNVAHLAFTPKKVQIPRSAGDEEVLRALEQANLLDYMREKVRVEAV